MRNDRITLPRHATQPQHSLRKHMMSQEEWVPHNFNNNSNNRCGRQNKFNLMIWSLRRNNHRLGTATETTVKEYQPGRAGGPTSPYSWWRSTTCCHCTVLNSSATVGTTRTGHVTRRKGSEGHGSHFPFQQSIPYIMVGRKMCPVTLCVFWHSLVLSEHDGIVLIAL